MNKNLTEQATTLAASEDYHALERLLSKNKGFDILNAHVSPKFCEWGPTPLYYITIKSVAKKMKDPCRMMRFLVSHGANPNLAANDGSTPLWSQTTNDGSLKLMQTLLELGANPNQISMEGKKKWTPLFHCLLSSPDESDDDILLSFQKAELLLKYGADPDQIYDSGKSEWTPLIEFLRPSFDKIDYKNHYPPDELSIEKAKFLLENGANPNLVCPALPLFPPLNIAIEYGFSQKNGETAILELIELMLQRGAYPNETLNSGQSLLAFAIEKGLYLVGELLLAYGAKKPEKTEYVYWHLTPEGRQRWNEMLEKYEKTQREKIVTDQTLAFFQSEEFEQIINATKNVGDKRDEKRTPAGISEKALAVLKKDC